MKLHEKIAKTEKAIESIKLQIAKEKEKLKLLERELKQLREKNDNQFATEFLKLINDKGFTTDEEKNLFLQQIKNISSVVTEDDSEKSDDYSVQKENSNSKKTE